MCHVTLDMWHCYDMKPVDCLAPQSISLNSIQLFPMWTDPADRSPIDNCNLQALQHDSLGNVSEYFDSLLSVPIRKNLKLNELRHTAYRPTYRM